MCSLPVAAATDQQGRGGSKPHRSLFRSVEVKSQFASLGHSLGVGRAVCLSGGSRGHPFPCLPRRLEAAGAPWLVASFRLQSQREVLSPAFLTSPFLPGLRQPARESSLRVRRLHSAPVVIAPSPRGVPDSQALGVAHGAFGGSYSTERRSGWGKVYSSLYKVIFFVF